MYMCVYVCMYMCICVIFPIIGSRLIELYALSSLVYVIDPLLHACSSLEIYFPSPCYSLDRNSSPAPNRYSSSSSRGEARTRPKTGVSHLL